MTLIRTAAIFGVALLSTAAQAQEPVAVGGSGRPSVEVNLDALDRLGDDSGVMIGQPYGSRYGRPALPNEARPGQAPIVLKPPPLAGTRSSGGSGSVSSSRVKRAALEPPPPPEPKPQPETPAPSVTDTTPAPSTATPTVPPSVSPPTHTAPPPTASAPPAPQPQRPAPPTTAAPPPSPPPAATASAKPATPPTVAPAPSPQVAETPRVLEPRRTETRPIAPETIAAAVLAGLPPIEQPASPEPSPSSTPAESQSEAPAGNGSSGSGAVLLAGGAFGSLGGSDEPAPASAEPAPAPEPPAAPAEPPAPAAESDPPQLLAGGAFGVPDRAPAAGAAPPPPPTSAAPPPQQDNAPRLLAGGALTGAPLPPGQGPITGSPAPRPPVAVTPADSRVVPPAPPGTQMAAAPSMAPAPAVEGPTLLRIGFEPGNEVLTPQAQSQLAQLAKRLAGNGERINVKAYAAGKDGTAARRLSLSRALAVRRFLGDQNVATARINVTAMGTPSDSGPADRVDIVSIGR